MQTEQAYIDSLIIKLFEKQLFYQWKQKEELLFKQQCKRHKQKEHQQIQNLELEDYLSLLANQKKSITFHRFMKLQGINNGSSLQQESYKHFFCIASQANYRRLEHPGYYKSLLAIVKQYPLSFFNAIEKDIHRTFLMNHPFQQNLREVLQAYAIRNPSLIYCQGMNYIVAFLLINEMSSEQTFWFMTCLVENILPDDYFKDLTTISIIICIINDLIQDIFPEFKLQMTEVGMDSSIFIVPWFVCLFTKGFINSVSAFLLNYILLESRKYKIGYILLKISLALLDIIVKREQSFRYSKDFKTFKDFLDTKFFEISLSEAQESLDIIEINYEVYSQIQEYYRKQKQENRNQNMKSRSKKISLPPCNKSYPICFHRIEMQKKAGFIENALILKSGYSIKDQMIENYLQMPSEISKQSKPIDYSDINQCLIGRQHHICHLNEQEYKTKHTKFQRELTVKIQLLPDQQKNNEQKLEYTNMEDRFAEYSEYFQVDQNYQEKQNIDDEFKKQLEEFSIEKQLAQNENLKGQQEKKQSKFSLFEATIIGKVFKRVGEKISDFKKMRERRESKTFTDIKVEDLSSVSI